MKKKEEVTITFYAAECGEFHDLGEYTKCRTLEEAYKKYQKYCRTSANMCPAIEFSIHDPESIYSDMEYPLPLSSKDRGDLELVPYYNEHPLVNEAIRQVELLQRFFILKVKLSGKDVLENLKEHIAQKKFSQFTFCAMEMKLKNRGSHC